MDSASDTHQHQFLAIDFKQAIGGGKQRADGHASSSSFCGFQAVASSFYPQDDSVTKRHYSTIISDFRTTKKDEKNHNENDGDDFFSPSDDCSQRIIINDDIERRSSSTTGPTSTSTMPSRISSRMSRVFEALDSAQNIIMMNDDDDDDLEETSLSSSFLSGFMDPTPLGPRQSRTLVKNVTVADNTTWDENKKASLQNLLLFHPMVPTPNGFTAPQSHTSTHKRKMDGAFWQEPEQLDEYFVSTSNQETAMATGTMKRPRLLLNSMQDEDQDVSVAAATLDDGSLDPIPITGTATFTSNRIDHHDTFPPYAGIYGGLEEQGQQYQQHHEEEDQNTIALLFQNKSYHRTGNNNNMLASIDASNNNIVPLRPHHCDQWNVRFQELQEFKHQFGHCIVPHDYPFNPKLAQWVKRQRYQHKLKLLNRHSTLTPMRQLALEQLGFVWDLHQVAWMEKLSTLQEYKRRYGDCNVPANYGVDPSLAIWVKCQRRQYRLFSQGKPSNMNPERISDLNQLNFDWNPRQI